MDNFNSTRGNTLLVDTGATAHILNDKSRFLKFDGEFKPENHYTELADGSRVGGVVLNNTMLSSGAHTAETWHVILGHCNMNDVFKLEAVVEGMKITTKGKPECDTCVQGKMSKYQNKKARSSCNCSPPVGP